MDANHAGAVDVFSAKRLRGIHVFALIFSAIFFLHAPLLRLPYFWDEAGYYIPAAYDVFTTGKLIPHSVPSNAHPPLPAIYLAFWWKFSAFRPAVTRTAMLLLAALALTAVFRLSRLLTNTAIAVATVVCTSAYPVWFAQSSLAHSDLPAAAFVLWALFFYFRNLVGDGFHQGSSGPVMFELKQARTEQKHHHRDEMLAIFFFSIAGLCKETAVIVPITLASYGLVISFRQRRASRLRTMAHSGRLLLSIAPLALWFWYHRRVTGFAFGNPEFFAYNVTATLTPLRILVSFLTRLWQILGYMNLWLLAVATVWVMRYPALREPDNSERPRILLAVQYRVAAIIVVNLLAFSALGGAVLARYLLPLYPLVILIGISTLRRRLPEWTWAVAVVLLGFVMALFSNPFGYIPPEDNLSYRNYVILHKEAANYLQNRDPHARVLTAWTATDELTKPFLGYVRQPMNVVHIENFSYEQLQVARLAPGEYDLVLLFSTKQEPTTSLLDHWPWAQRISRRYFGFHYDLPPEVAAGMLGGRVTWERRRGMQWVAVVSFDRVENARKEQRSMNEGKRIAELYRSVYEGDDQGEAWHGLALRPLLKDIRPERAAQHPKTGSHSILQLVLHIAYWEEVTLRRFNGEVVSAPLNSPEDWPQHREITDSEWQAVLARLHAAHTALRQVIERSSEDKLSSKVPERPYDNYTLLHGTIHHCVYHSGQIAMLKKSFS